MRMTVQVTYIFIPIVSLKDSFCHSGKSELVIGLFIHELLREPLITSADIFKFVDIWHLSVAKEILFTFNQVFCDVDVTESEEPESDNTLECFDEDFFYFDIEDSLFAGLPDDDFYIVEDSLQQHGPGEEELDSDLE